MFLIGIILTTFIILPHNLCLNKHIPMKNITVHSKDKVFMNNTIRKLMRKRNRLHRKAVTDEEELDQINILKF